MKSEDLDTGDADLLRRYREASEAHPVQPSETTRNAILAEARRIAEVQARPEALKPFDRREPAANQSRWRFAAVGTVGVALFAVILMIPAYRQTPSTPPSAEQATPPAVARLDREGDAVAGSQALEESKSAPARAPQLEEFDRNPRSMAKIAAGAPSRDKAREESAARANLSGEPRALQQRSQAVADAALAQAAIPPVAQMAPAAPPVYAPVPAESVSRAERRNEPAPLLAAVRDGDLAQVTQLLVGGASVAESDDAGRSPLLLAVLAQRGDVVRALLAHGADPNAVDRSGQTPLGAARERHLEDIVAALRQAGARER